ncbi:type VI secretion system tip protein VgrG [Leptothoe spongobia]|uniref:Type VI secretion system tip protein VgrG n=1 Tax=Leptothoe spongobia TAU-MAC 1115 TaxID=1967444 RepID=A0A947DD18_9CYAN|nr:type VI secretion system tip protein VgrG [Leptothoe spongobia]MBT9314478.1 type VI secretion system tip protein VgrG [Leptothoe spongobia TAU-MAC 1115]
MDPKFGVVHVDIVKDVNRIPSAQITLIDGSASEQTFPISNNDFFAPGQEIEIQLRYEQQSKDETVFKGIVVKHAVEASFNPYQSYLHLYLKDAAIKLTTQRKNMVFKKSPDKKITDSEIIQKIIETAKLEVGDISKSTSEHGEMVQYYCTDWDFMIARADANGLWVIVDDGKITVMSPTKTEMAAKSVAFTAEYGSTTIYSLEMEADIQHQYGAISSQSWDVTTQALATAVTGKDSTSLPGNLKPDELAATIGADNYNLITGLELSPSEMQTWANAKMEKTRLSMLRGRFRVPGLTNTKPGDVVEIAGVSDRFNGKTLVSGIRHQVSKEGWQTDVQFGMAADWFSQNQDITEMPASGLVPVVNGLQIGIVDKYEEDKENKYRVRVKVPALSSKDNAAGELIWARLATLDAGANRGTFFRPELNDEVVLGFLHDDPRQAIILGALYSKKNVPPWTVDEDNFLKGIVTKKNLQVTLDDTDDQESITLETPGKNKIVLTDKKDDESIQLTDKHGNTLVMNKDGIQLSSSKDINIKASGNVKIEGKAVDVI